VSGFLPFRAPAEASQTDMSEGALTEGRTASEGSARVEAEERVLGRLDHALRSLRNVGVPQSVPPAPRPVESRERRILHPDRKRAALALALAHAHFGAGALEAAEREFRDAVALEPENADAHCGLVVTLANLFRLDEAERELQAAEQAGVRLSPSVRDEIEKRRAAGPS
jgi:tetratricopeptide (TPR) repeat protein